MEDEWILCPLDLDKNWCRLRWIQRKFLMFYKKKNHDESEIKLHPRDILSNNGSLNKTMEI